MNPPPAPASSWEALAAALFAKDCGGDESDGMRSATPDSENSDAEYIDGCLSSMSATTTTAMTGCGPTSSVLSYAAANGRQASGGGSKRKRAVLKGSGATSTMMLVPSVALQQHQQHQPATPTRSAASALTSTSTIPPLSSAAAAAAALAPLRNAMLSWSAALTRLQPKCVVDDGARERGLRLLVRYQRAVRGLGLGGGGGSGGSGAPSSASSPSSSSSSSCCCSSPAPSSSSCSPPHHLHRDFCSSPTSAPAPAALTHAQVASALWIAIKAEGVRCAVPSRGLLARATGVAPAELAAAELSVLVALKFDVFLGDVLHFREEEEALAVAVAAAAAAAGKENAMV